VPKRFDNWNIKDINANKQHEAIVPLSARAWSLLVRNRTKPLLKVGFVNVTGAIEMLEGLEYHYDNIIRLANALATGERVSETNVNHEAIAYINRLGQFYYFAQSEFVRTAISDFKTLIPTISKFIVFRHKNTAHRSIDTPKNESYDLKLAHARALSSMMGSLFSPKPNTPAMKLPEVGVTVELEQMQRELWTHNCRTFQTFDSAIGSHLNFTVEIEHPNIVNEAYSVVERVILNE
jgi:hypothetical protein